MKKYEEHGDLSVVTQPGFPSFPSAPSPIEFPRWKGRSLPRWAVRFLAAVDLGLCPQGRNVGGAADLLGSVQEASRNQTGLAPLGKSEDHWKFCGHLWTLRPSPLPFRATRDLRWRTWQHKSCYLGFLSHGIIGPQGSHYLCCVRLGSLILCV